MPVYLRLLALIPLLRSFMLLEEVEAGPSAPSKARITAFEELLTHAQRVAWLIDDIDEGAPFVDGFLRQRVGTSFFGLLPRYVTHPSGRVWTGSEFEIWMNQVGQLFKVKRLGWLKRPQLIRRLNVFDQFEYDTVRANLDRLGHDARAA